MKNAFFISIVLLTGLNCSSSQPVLEQFEAYRHKEKLLVGVLPIENKTGEKNTNAVLSPLSGILIVKLKETGRYRVIERERITDLLKEQKLSLTGFIDAGTASKIGKMLGVDAVLLSSVTRIQYKKGWLFGLIAWINKQRVEVDIQGRVVDVATGEILATASATTEAWDREWVAFYIFRLGGKNGKKQLESMALDYAMKKLCHKLGEKAVKK